jgi:hypothetical protein
MSYPTDVGVPHKKKTLSATKPTNISQEQEPIGYKYLPIYATPFTWTARDVSRCNFFLLFDLFNIFFFPPYYKTRVPIQDSPLEKVAETQNILPKDGTPVP